MSIGSLALKIQQKYQYGLKTTYYRDTVRNRILDTRPFLNTQDFTCEIHVLTYEKDWLNLIWALKSFYHYSQRCYALCIHDDGTLTAEQCAILQHHFPKARILKRSDADRHVMPTLQSYPRCLEFRKTNHLAPKVFDFVEYLESDRMFLLDSDVLFFTEPTELLKRLEDPGYQLNTVNGDVASAYTVNPVLIQETLGFTVIERFNSGLGLIHKASLNLDWIEEFLGLPDIIGHFWRIEQTLYALCSSRFGVELLPPEYDVSLSRGVNRLPCRHYVGQIRHLMYCEGIQHLVRNRFLQELSQ
ncbi:MAG: hypothetical protein KME16_04405 [Scytolyngbya sp. HA4215-MV1]|jgi:hypothetical protein|nr:hypothetical protein [Scytolyngbya sp. HA4215-MV1]